MEFRNFWGGFETNKKVQSLFNDITGGQGTMTCVGTTWPVQTIGRVNGCTFSGEPYHSALGDVNMIPGGEVPVHLFAITAYERDAWSNLMTRTVTMKPDRFCAFCVGNGSVRIRNTFFCALSQYKKVDSCGTFANNLGYCAPRSDEEYWKFLSHYKFNICFENTNIKDYVTEKLFNAYMGGSIPIYWGTPQVLEWFNPRAFLYLENENDMESLVKKVIDLDTNDELYQKMRAEPLLRDGMIPHDMKMETWKEKFELYRTRISP